MTYWQAGNLPEIFVHIMQCTRLCQNFGTATSYKTGNMKLYILTLAHQKKKIVWLSEYDNLADLLVWIIFVF